MNVTHVRCWKCNTSAEPVHGECPHCRATKVMEATRAEVVHARIAQGLAARAPRLDMPAPKLHPIDELPEWSCAAGSLRFALAAGAACELNVYPDDAMKAAAFLVAVDRGPMAAASDVVVTDIAIGTMRIASGGVELPCDRPYRLHSDLPLLIPCVGAVFYVRNRAPAATVVCVNVFGRSLRALEAAERARHTEAEW